MELDKLMTDTTVEEEAQELYRVIAEGEKIVHFTEDEHGFALSVLFKLPTHKQKNRGEMLYNKAFNALLKDTDQMTTKELLEIAEKRGNWSEEDNERLGNVDNEIIAKKEEADSAKEGKKKEKLIDELSELREEKFRLALRIGQLTSTSIENVAETERTIYMLQNCALVIDDAGQESPLFATKEDVENEQNLEKLQRITLEGKDFWSGEGLSNFLHLDG